MPAVKLGLVGAGFTPLKRTLGATRVAVAVATLGTRGGLVPTRGKSPLAAAPNLIAKRAHRPGPVLHDLARVVGGQGPIAGGHRPAGPREKG